MCDRITATSKLLFLIKTASTALGSKSSEEAMESLVIEAGIHALRSLGVSEKEIAEATMDLILGSPMMGNIDDDSPVSTGNAKDSEW